MQSAAATQLIEGFTEELPGFISMVVLVELVWVLQSGYALTRQQISQALQQLVQPATLKLDRVIVVAAATRMFGSGKADFADCLIERIAAHAGCVRTMTHDKAAAKTGGMVLI